MRASAICLAGLILTLPFARVASAQQYSPTPVPSVPAPVPSVPNPYDSPAAIPGPVPAGVFNQAIAGLADQPGTHTGFVFDRNMLEFAQGVLESQGMDAHRAAIALTGVAFDSYRYAQPAFYSPEGMQALIAQYRTAGWKHMVNANETPQNTAQPRRMVTDLWLHFSGADIDHVTVLTRAPKNMTVVQISGDLRPLDLLHLGGHFGIPKVDPNAIMVPDRQ